MGDTNDVIFLLYTICAFGIKSIKLNENNQVGGTVTTFKTVNFSRINLLVLTECAFYVYAYGLMDFLQLLTILY